jgi:phosphocarrier protein HPr
MSVERDVEVAGELGLHARPAAAFADAAARFAAKVTVERDGREVDAKSVLLLLTLDVRQGDHIHLRADGPDESEAVDALTHLVAS